MIQAGSRGVAPGGFETGKTAAAGVTLERIMAEDYWESSAALG